MRAAEGEMQARAARACPVCFCSAAAGVKSRQEGRGQGRGPDTAEREWEVGVGKEPDLCAAAQAGPAGAKGALLALDSAQLSMQVRSIALPRLQRVAEQGSVVVNDPRQGSSGAKEPGSRRGKGRDFQVRTRLSDQGKVPQLSCEWSCCWCDQLPGAACTCVAPC